MPAPWEYENVELGDDLAQGDVLIPTPELRKLFIAIHPYFSESKYVAFLVTTQTCDLVRRSGECSARYVNLAVVRSLREVLWMLLDAECERVGEGCYVDRDKQRAQLLLRRMFNQNEQAKGLFYLYPDARLKLSHDAVALLRVGVTFRAQHYGALCGARRVRIPPEFANKLGWLVGNLYSRIGTPDWQDEELRNVVDGYLSSTAGSSPVWIAKAVVKRMLREGDDLQELSQEELRQKARTKLPTPKAVAIPRIIEAVKAVFPDSDDTALGRLKIRLENDPTLTKTFRQQ